MAITAARLGKSGVTLDCANLARINAPSALPNEHLLAAWNETKKNFSLDPAKLSELQNEVNSFTQSRLASGQYSDALVIGDGASFFAANTIINALTHRKKQNGLNLHFISAGDTSLPTLLLQLKAEQTLILIINEDGDPAVTANPLVKALSWLGLDRWPMQVCAVLGGALGELHELCQKHSVHAIPIKPGLTASLQPSVLLTLALAGLDYSEYLSGAKHIDDYQQKTPDEKNLIMSLSLLLAKHKNKRPAIAWIPLTKKLNSTAGWMACNWSNAFTSAPIDSSNGLSHIANLTESADEKLVLFLTVDATEKQPENHLALSPAFGRFRSLSSAAQAQTSAITYASHQATATVLVQKNRPCFTFQLEDITEKAFGGLVFTAELLAQFFHLALNQSPSTFAIKQQTALQELKNQVRHFLWGKIESDTQEERDHLAATRLRLDRERTD